VGGRKEGKRGGKKEGGEMCFSGVEGYGNLGGKEIKLIKLDGHECFEFSITCKRTNNANNATHYVKLGKKRRENFKRNYCTISPRVIIKAIIIISEPQ